MNHSVSGIKVRIAARCMAALLGAAFITAEIGRASCRERVFKDV